MTFLPFIIQRARRHWQVLTTLCLGVLLATALLATGPLLADTVVELGLRHTLLSSGPLQSHLRVSSRGAARRPEYEALDEQVQTLLQAHLGQKLERVVQSVGSNWMFPWVEGRLAADERINLHFYADIENQVEFIAGGWPDSLPGLDVLPVVIGDEVARAYALRVGDRMPLSFSNQGLAPDVWIQVAGIVRPKNPRSPYWFGEFSPLTSQRTQRWEAQYHALLSEEVFFSVVPALFPASKINIAWQALVRPGEIKTQDIAATRAQIADLGARLRRLENRAVLETELDEVLQDYQEQAQAIRAPLYILLAEVVLLALYYVTMVAALAVRQVEREFAVLRSRGASGRQIAQMQLTEAGLIGAVALLSGPVVGLALVRGLVWAGPLADVSQSGWGLNFTRGAWLAGLLLPIGPALRSNVVTHQLMTSRSARPPWWQRAHLDVFVLLGGLLLLWRLHLYGSLVGGAGRLELDGLLLLAPLALLLGAATVLLRVFPLMLRGLAALATRARGLPGALAMWQASRNPTHVARLVLLLTLAIALGILSTGLNATLDQSEFERSRYLAGTDMRLVSKRHVPLLELQAAPGVLDLAGTWRGTGMVNLQSGRNYPRFEVLALDPASFINLTLYRDDFAERYMGELLGHLLTRENQGPPLLPLPGQPARLGVWVRATMTDQEMGTGREILDGDSDGERVGVRVKLQTAQGEVLTLKLRQPVLNAPGLLSLERLVLRLSNRGRETQLNFRMNPSGGWRYVEAALPALAPSSYPLALHSLWFTNYARRTNDPVAADLHVSMDDVMVVDAATGAAQVVEAFENPAQIWSLGDPASTARFTRDRPRSGQGNLVLELRFVRALQTVGMKLTQGKRPGPLPVIVSPAFLDQTELVVGDVAYGWIDSVAVELEIIGAVRYFPTMYEDAPAGYVITSRDLLPLLNSALHHAVNLNEVLIASDEHTGVDALVSRTPDLAQAWEAEAVRKTYKSNPLALGLRSVTFFGYSLTTLLSLVGFATHFYMSTRQRETVYGVMRAMGMSPRQLYGSLVLEQVVLILSGLALGTALGVLLNQITLPRLPIALGESLPVPPFRPRSDWLAVGRIYATPCAACAAIGA